MGTPKTLEAQKWTGGIKPCFLNDRSNRSDQIRCVSYINALVLLEHFPSTGLLRDIKHRSQLTSLFYFSLEVVQVKYKLEPHQVVLLHTQLMMSVLIMYCLK